MAIQYQDGTLGPVGPAAEVAKQLADHFSGLQPLPKEPAGAVFGRTPEEVQAKAEKEAQLAALDDRIRALEQVAGARARGLVVPPTPEEVAQVRRGGRASPRSPAIIAPALWRPVTFMQNTGEVAVQQRAPIPQSAGVGARVVMRRA